MKSTVRNVIVLAVVFLAGLATMRLWDAHRNATDETLPSAQRTASIELVDMEDSSLPQGVTYAEKEAPIKKPQGRSHLSSIDVPELEAIISKAGAVYYPAKQSSEPAQLPPSIELDSQTQVALGPEGPLPISPADSETKIAMIDAPVQALVIKTLGEYRQFKRRARGSYPTVDFTKHHVLVLESASNLPDKAFEIDSTREEDGKLQVYYRVNVFGLDKKTNTHNVVVISKKELPLTLKQVL